MRTFGKLALLLVVIGWFCPIACGQNGPSLVLHTQELPSDNWKIAGILLLISVIIAAIGLFFIMNDKKSGKIETIASTVVGGIGLALIQSEGRGSMLILNTGAFIMIIGWIVSLILQFIPYQNPSFNYSGGINEEEAEYHKQVQHLEDACKDCVTSILYFFGGGAILIPIIILAYLFDFILELF